MGAKMTKEQKEAFEKWKEHCREVQTLTAVSMAIAKETPVERDRRINGCSLTMTNSASIIFLIS